MPDEAPAVPMWIENRLLLPRCCPVSKNPQPGSTLRLRYRARGRVLEVYSLKAYIESFVDGHADGTRNMEAMIQRIAQTCADALQTPVRACAELELVPYQHLRLTCMARPNDLLSGDAPDAMAGQGDGASVPIETEAVRTQGTTEGDL
jgi:hypothetical protein